MPDIPSHPIVQGFRYGYLSDSIWREAGLPAGKADLKTYINQKLEKLLARVVPSYNPARVLSSWTRPQLCVGTGNFANIGRYFQRKHGGKKINWLTLEQLVPTFLDDEEIARLVLAREELEMTRNNLLEPPKAGSFRNTLAYVTIYNHFYYDYFHPPSPSVSHPSHSPDTSKYPLSPPPTGSRKRRRSLNPTDKAPPNKQPLKRPRPTLLDLTGTFINSRSPSPLVLPRYVLPQHNVTESPSSSASSELRDSDAENQTPEYAPPLLFLFWTESGTRFQEILLVPEDGSSFRLSDFALELERRGVDLAEELEVYDPRSDSWLPLPWDFVCPPNPNPGHFYLVRYHGLKAKDLIGYDVVYQHCSTYPLSSAVKGKGRAR